MHERHPPKSAKNLRKRYCFSNFVKKQPKIGKQKRWGGVGEGVRTYTVYPVSRATFFQVIRVEHQKLNQTTPYGAVWLAFGRWPSLNSAYYIMTIIRFLRSLKKVSRQLPATINIPLGICKGTLWKLGMLAQNFLQRSQKIYYGHDIKGTNQ